MESPQVPQRPSRSAGPASDNTLVVPPTVPPRPSNRQNDPPSASPIENVRSPLNVSPFQPPDSSMPPEQVNDLERMPSVATLPLVGEEGMEYDSLDRVTTKDSQDSKDHPAEPEHTRMVAGDLPIHAPQASNAPITMRSKVEPMTRIDSAGAASAGLAKPYTEHDDSQELPSRSKEYRPGSASSHELARSTSRQQSSRPESMYGEEFEHGIPHIGVHVPMNPNAGDVQAPSPSNFHAGHSTGVGFFNSTSSHRRKSSQGFHGPPGSYGLHGHGIIPKDQFEKSWYQKHPEELTKEEQGAYGPGMHNPRSQWAMSSDDLNKIVHDSATKRSTTPGIPSEDIGYRVSEEHSSRMNSPQVRAVKSRTSSQTYAESPLRKASFPDDVHGAHAFDSEDDDHIHLDHPKATTPSLAPDEVKKYPHGEWLHPAVSPSVDRNDDDDYFNTFYPTNNHGHPRSPKASRHGINRPGSAKFHHDFENHGTHLDEIEEYEPLFVDDNKQQSTPPRTAADRLKRPDLDRRRFPSQDVWEDTPTSLQLSTEIEDIQEQEENQAAAASRPPLQSSKSADDALTRQTSFLDDEEYKATKIKNALPHDHGIQRHFPSRDIWEDTPDSLYLVTTVDESQEPPTPKLEEVSPTGVADKPAVPARPVRSKDTDTTSTQPSVPPRPPQRPKQAPPAESTSPTDRQAPAIPGRPKPQIPARPSKIAVEDFGDGEAITKTTSAGSTGSVDATSPTDRSITSPTSGKQKPVVPSKPTAASGKFSSIKSGFMDDLNSRLQLGPQAKKPAPQIPSEPAAEEDKAPLNDARKARARGPARRKPAEPSASDNTTSAASGSANWGIVQPWNVWSISNSGQDSLVMGKPSTSFSPASGQEEPAPSVEQAGDAEAPMSPQSTEDAAGTVAISNGDGAGKEQVGDIVGHEIDSEAVKENSASVDEAVQTSNA